MKKQVSIKSEPSTLPHRWLLSLYLIIPFSFLLIGIDVLFLNSKLQSSLPYNPQSNFVLNIFFVIPHILGSSFSFLDTEYLRYYNVRLLFPIIAISVAVVYLPSIIGEFSYECMYSVWTIVHVIGQQFGIALIAIQRKTWLYFTWRWLGIILSLPIYIGLYFPYLGGVDIMFFIRSYGVYTFVFFAIISHLLQLQSPKSSIAPYASLYIWVNFTLILSCWLLLLRGYPFFVQFVPRFIHDISAFMVYMNHDHNRNSLETKNLLYIPFRFLKLPAIVLNPLLSILFGYILVNICSEHLVGQYFINVLTLVHYYTDSFSWQRDSPHRKFLSIK